MHYHLSCRKCNSQVSHPLDVNCPSCGKLVRGQLIRDEAASIAGLACPFCSRSITDRVTLPTNCSNCHSYELGWKSESTGEWLVEQISNGQDLPDGQWITGDFDGDYDHSKSSGIFSFFSQKSVQITSGNLANAVLIDTPPEILDVEESRPLRQDAVVTYIRSINDGVPLPVPHQLNLVDFRLHRWNHVKKPGDKEFGRVTGTAYGLVKVIKPIDMQEGEAKQPSPITPQHQAEVTSQPQEDVIEEKKQDECDSSCGIFFWLLAFVIPTLACDFWVGVLAVTPLILHCIIRKLGANTRIAQWCKRRLSTGFGWLLFFTALGFLIYGLYFSGCDAKALLDTNVFGEPLWVWVILLALTLSLFICRLGFWFLLLRLIWILALILVCTDSNSGCKSGALENLLPKLQMPLQQAIRSGLTSIDPRTYQDSDTTAATSQPGGHRISLDQALKEPEKFFSCPPGSANGNHVEGSNGDVNAEVPSIYLSELALFEKNKDTLTPEAQQSMQKLQKLLAAAPGAKIVLTGHTDRTGTDAVNIPLSKERAARVSDWLVSNKVIMPNQVEVLGAGSVNPIVDMVGDIRLNRRVELRRDCSKG